jgi:hypothetical protein
MRKVLYRMWYACYRGSSPAVVITYTDFSVRVLTPAHRGYEYNKRLARKG